MSPHLPCSNGMQYHEPMFFISHESAAGIWINDFVLIEGRTWKVMRFFSKFLTMRELIQTHVIKLE